MQGRDKTAVQGPLELIIFQGCHGVLLPGRSARVGIVGPTKEKAVSVCCEICNTEKRFLLEEKKQKQKEKKKKTKK